jgi:hypothetical protein
MGIPFFVCESPQRLAHRYDTAGSAALQGSVYLSGTDSPLALSVSVETLDSPAYRRHSWSRGNRQGEWNDLAQA